MSNIQAQYPEFVRKLFNRTGDNSKDFAHAILGIVTEVDELLTATDSVNATEEHGDLCFFCVALQQVVIDVLGTEPSIEELKRTSEHTLTHLNEPHYSEIVRKLSKRVLDHAKRWVGYGKMPADILLAAQEAITLADVATRLSPLASTDMDHTLSANMAKLLKRYPGGEFDSFRAVVRDLEAEREALQSV
jgi:hypothetical protein